MPIRGIHLATISYLVTVSTFVQSEMSLTFPETSGQRSVQIAIDKQILIYPDANYHMEEFEIFETLT